VPSFNATDSSDDPDVRDPTAMGANMGSEENHIPDFGDLVCGEGLWWDSPAMKATVGESSQKWAVVFEKTAFRGILGKRGENFSRRTLALDCVVNVYGICRTDVHDKAIHLRNVGWGRLTKID
jgi:hypothetical protein